MKTDIKKLKENSVEITVEVAKGSFDDSIKKAYAAISKKAKIPGFRAGKIPPKVIDSHFGNNYVLQQALDSDLSKFYSEAILDNGIKPIDKPKVEVITLDKSKGLKFKAQVEVEPEVELADFKDIKIELKAKKAKKEEVDARINVLRDKVAELKPVAGKAAGEKDYVLINFEGKIDGKTFEGSSAKDFSLEIGSKTFLPEFERELIGSKAGDIKNINVKIPQQVPNKEIAGKLAIFNVLVKEVKVKILPEIDDKFANEIAGFSSVQEMKKQIKKDLQTSLDKQAENEYRMELLKEFSDKAKVDIPKVMIDTATEDLLKDFEHSLKNQGSNLEDYLSSQKIGRDELKKNLRKSAEERTRQELAVRTLIEKEKISATDDDINKTLEELSEGKEKPITRKDLEEKNLIGHIESRIILDKAIDLIAKKSKTEAKK